MIYECEELGYCPHMSDGFVSCRDHCGLGADEDEYSETDILIALSAADNEFIDFDDEYKVYVDRVRDRVYKRF